MRIRKRKPTHPGALIKREYMEPLHLTVTALAAHLGVSRKHLSNILNEKVAVTPDVAMRLSRAFNTTPELWLNLQRACDLWELQQAGDWHEVEVLPNLARA